MKMFLNYALILSVLTTVVLLIPTNAFCQTEKLGIVSYAPPKGWTKTPKENVVGFTQYNQTGGGFCIITLYGATGGSGNPQSDFTKEWNRLAVSALKTGANPKTETQTDGGWTMTAGGAAVDADGIKGVALLTVFSGYGKTVSVLGVFNDSAYAAQFETFIGSIEIDKTFKPADNAPTISSPTSSKEPGWTSEDGKLVVPQPARQLTVADLVGEWGDNPGRIATTYVNRSDGSYAGTDSLHFTSKTTFDRSGGWTNDFFEVRNGKKLSDATTGTATVTGRVLALKRPGSTQFYVVRGWLELPDMTILVIAGPWYNEQDIPERVFSDFGESSRFILTTRWIRVKK